MSRINRLAIYVVYDKDGIIDDYIPYFLNDLCQNISHLIVVCNGKLTDEGRNKLLRFTDDIYVRPNVGYDCGAVQDVLINLYGWEKVYKYNELLICNDSVYGPLYPFTQVFDEMDKRAVDFWGLTEQPEITELSHFHIPTSPRHLQSYFVNIKNNMLKSEAFHMFWTDIDTKDFLFTDAVIQYEFKFTKYFSEYGYRHSVYVDTSDLYSKNARYNYVALFVDPYDMITEYHSPIIKRKSLAYNTAKTLEFYANDKNNLIMQYIEKETRYDINLIWDNLLRTADLMTIKNTLHLHYVFPTKSTTSLRCEFTDKKIAVIVHLFYPELVNECVQYIQNIPAYIDIFITTSRIEIIQKIDDMLAHVTNIVQVRKVENHGRDTAALLIDCHDLLLQYDYLCFVHDTKSSSDISLRTGRSYMFLLWENTLTSQFYIENVLDAFIENKRLGFLATPQPFHAAYFSKIGNECLMNFSVAEKLANKLNLRGSLSPQDRPFFLGTAFWCRTAAMRTLFEFKFNRSDFPKEPAPTDGTIMHAIERIFPFVAQHEGYYSGVMMSDKYAAVRSVDLEYMLSGLMNSTREKYIFSNYNQLIESITEDHIKQFCANNSTIYIYGAGGDGNWVADVLEQNGVDYTGFIVSDGKINVKSLRSHPVYYLSEIISHKDKCGIIIGMNCRNTAEVMPLLKNLGFINLYKLN